ncbi:MAG TPA: hypothetical protein VFG14_16850, partial [Chthoniobacteraceae bacterium]|nr:hypothetical protein [Chthoniobacteraceae bacterium]
MKSALLRKSILTLGIAVTTLALTPSEARAGGAELKKLETELGKTVGSASTTELLTALTNLISSSTINAAVVTGEALKGATSATAADFGVELAELLNGGTFPEVTSTNLAKFIGQASKTAATGKIPNTLHLTDFSAGVLSDDSDNTAALAAAKAAIGSKTAAGIILGGRALGLSDDDAEALALASLADKSLKSAAQATSQYVGDTVSDIVDFTLALSSPAANLKLIKSIAPGAAAASPSEAHDIVEALFDTAATQITTRSIAPALAKSVASVADTEVVTFIAITMGEEIQAGNISFKKVNSIAKGLTQGLVLRPVDNEYDDAAVRFSTTNKL